LKGGEGGREGGGGDGRKEWKEGMEGRNGGKGMDGKGWEKRRRREVGRKGREGRTFSFSISGISGSGVKSSPSGQTISRMERTITATFWIDVYSTYELQIQLSATPWDKKIGQQGYSRTQKSVSKDIPVQNIQAAKIFQYKILNQQGYSSTQYSGSKDVSGQKIQSVRIFQYKIFRH
jgi:hypothetical protein